MINLINHAQNLGDAAAKSEEHLAENSRLSRWDRIGKIVSIVANLAVIIVAILAYAQYREANLDLKRTRSLAFVEEWTEKGYSSAYNQLSSFVETKRQLGDRFPPGLDAKAEAVAKFNLGERWVTEILGLSSDADVKTVQNIDSTIQFFSRMSICESSDLCDEHVLTAYFDTELVTFWDYFAPYAAKRREDGYVGYGSKAEALVRLFRKNLSSTDPKYQ